MLPARGLGSPAYISTKARRLSEIRVPGRRTRPCFPSRKVIVTAKSPAFTCTGHSLRSRSTQPRIAVGQIETNVLISQNIFRQAVFRRIESQPERGAFKTVPSDEKGQPVYRAVVPTAEQHAALFAERLRRAETDGRGRQQIGPDLASAYFHTSASGSTDYGFGNRAVVPLQSEGEFPRKIDLRYGNFPGSVSDAGEQQRYRHCPPHPLQAARNSPRHPTSFRHFSLRCRY